MPSQIGRAEEREKGCLASFAAREKDPDYITCHCVEEACGSWQTKRQTDSLRVSEGKSMELRHLGDCQFLFPQNLQGNIFLLLGILGRAVSIPGEGQRQRGWWAQLC